MSWTGPNEEDLLLGSDALKSSVPTERYPWCLPDEHDLGCSLLYGGKFCDCYASAMDCFVDDPCEACLEGSEITL